MKKFRVEVQRTSFGWEDILVKAASKREAKNKALKALIFYDEDAEYKVISVEEIVDE